MMTVRIDPALTGDAYWQAVWKRITGSGGDGLLLVPIAVCVFGIALGMVKSFCAFFGIGKRYARRSDL